MQTFAPKDEREVAEAVSAAIADGAPLEVSGTRSKRGLGRPSEAVLRLNTAAMNGVSLYEPSELCLRAASGTPVRSIIALIAQQGQELAFEPMDYGPLLGAEPMSGTAGGLIAVNASGSRRIKTGAARDHLLGFRAVSGRGEVFQSGGRVMKNVTGYDLSKLMAGSFGTLAVLTEVTLKVLPKAPSEETLIMSGLEDAEAIRVLTEASGLPQDVSSFAHLPAKAADSLTALSFPGSVTAMRLEGPTNSVSERKQALLKHFHGRCRSFDTLDESQSKQFWASVRDAVPVASLDANIWRVSTAPMEGPAIISKLATGDTSILSWFYDWAGGLIWLATERSPDAHAPAIRSAVNEAGGHATLIRASNEVRRSVPVFHPQPPALAALSARIKMSFDPERILNRGRMREDL
ncbi:MAG: FAD-binding protein [Rhodomicrobium sp.]